MLQFRQLLESSSSPDPQALGDLMNASFASCRDDFGCSCPELDELVALGRKSGSLGSRLTGAGWGGSTVSLIQRSDQERFLEALQTGYFAKHAPDLRGEALDRAVFASEVRPNVAVSGNIDASSRSRAPVCFRSSLSDAGVDRGSIDRAAL